ncbi:MAG: hypothetical protein Q4D29_08955 [Lachnospiraceae bacterium]|nr:hypothetical protein [Lachnospiraceae bacterium]
MIKRISKIITFGLLCAGITFTSAKVASATIDNQAIDVSECSHNKENYMWIVYGDNESDAHCYLRCNECSHFINDASRNSPHRIVPKYIMVDSEVHKMVCNEHDAYVSYSDFAHDSDGEGGKCSKCGYESPVACTHQGNHTWKRIGDDTKHEKWCLRCGNMVEEHPIEKVDVLYEAEPGSSGYDWICYNVRCKYCLEHGYESTPLSAVYHKPGEGNKCTRCHKQLSQKAVDGIVDHYRHFGIEIKAPSKSEEKKEEKKDLSAEAFGGRKAEQLSVEEQKTAVSYAIENLRASGNALAANVVTMTNSGNGKAADVAAVVADNRDAANQQIFAQVMCNNLGFKNVTPLKTYNMYALHASYDAKNNKQTITWANTGLKPGDTAFVVWYNQKLGKIELLPAFVGPNGAVAVSVPALGDVSTMTVVKASK